MAGFFDIGREKARHIVDKVSKAAYLRDVDRSGSSADNMDVTSKLPSASQKPYAFTTFKRALDDTDTLLLRDTSFNRTFSLSRTSEPAANRPPSADAGTGSTESSRQGPPADNSAWDLPLTSFAKAPRATVIAQSGPNDVPQTAPTPHAAVGICDNAATLVATSKSEAAHAVENLVRPSAIATAADEGAICSAPEATAAAAEIRHDSGPGPTPVAAPPSPTAGSIVTAASAASRDVDAILEVPVSAVHNIRPAATAHQPDQASIAAAAAAPTVSRPGVADAANLIAPGLVAKRRMAAIAAVESKEGPSPELQATPIIVTEGAGEKSKAGSRVKLSAW